LDSLHINRIAIAYKKLEKIIIEINKSVEIANDEEF